MENEIDSISAPPDDDDGDVSLGLPILPEETIREILLRLPVRSLLRFRCVSKSWLLLISSYDFAKAHLKILTENVVYLYERLIFGPKWPAMGLYTCSLQSAVEDTVSTGSIYPITDENLVDPVWFDCAVSEPYYMMYLVGSCNGLVCVSVTPNTFILWNPTTRKSRILPDSGTDMYLSYSSLAYALGYDEPHDDYKVVKILGFQRDSGAAYEIEVKVCSLRDNSWKILPNWPGGDTFGGPGKFLNGAIHWSVINFDRPERWTIISHILATDTFVEIPLLNLDDYGDDVRVEVTILGGRLAVCCEHNVYMDVWLMEEYGVRKSWTKLLNIPFFLNIRDHRFLRPLPLSLWADSKVLINYGSTLRVYVAGNPDTHEFTHEFTNSPRVDATTYFESLISPHLDGSCV